jgi:hypothetical protein
VIQSRTLLLIFIFFWYTENIECTTSEMLETVLSHKVLDRETPMGSEDVLSSPTCTQPNLQNEQSKSIVTFAASAEASFGAKQESVKLNSSPMHDTKTAYSSSVSPFLNY